MRVVSLSLHNFRMFPEILFSPYSGVNILLGKNARGKTTVLEAIYLLSTARSWRAGRDSEMILWDKEFSRVTGQICREEQNDIDIGIHLSKSEKKQVYVNTIRQTKLADLLGELNVVLIEPHDVDIVRGDPGIRRRFMNLEISQIQPQYCQLIADYRRVLDQRNRLLKEMSRNRAPNGVLEVLSEQLADHGSKITERRLAFVNRIADLGRVIHSQITEEQEVLQIRYVCSVMDIQSCPSAQEIAERMREKMRELRNEEIARGMTLIGPQRDDLMFLVNGVDARTYGSQGQQRTIALSLRLAELELMEEEAGEPPVVLLDDVMTDLDEDRRNHVFAMTQGRCQTFVTAASPRAFDEDFVRTGRVFQVSEGRIDAG